MWPRGAENDQALWKKQLLIRDKQIDVMNHSQRKWEKNILDAGHTNVLSEFFTNLDSKSTKRSVKIRPTNHVEIYFQIDKSKMAITFR